MNTTGSGEFWDLRLYIAGQTPKATAVLARLRETCEIHLEGRHRITVIDLVKQPQRASADQIVATPTVVRRFPKPARTFIGNLSSVSQLLVDVNPRHAD
jgi:circadian clock protein KaiB